MEKPMLVTIMNFSLHGTCWYLLQNIETSLNINVFKYKVLMFWWSISAIFRLTKEWRVNSRRRPWSAQSSNYHCIYISKLYRLKTFVRLKQCLSLAEILYIWPKTCIYPRTRKIIVYNNSGTLILNKRCKTTSAKGVS